jgi:hypothetical protein
MQFELRVSNAVRINNPYKRLLMLKRQPQAVQLERVVLVEQQAQQVVQRVQVVQLVRQEVLLVEQPV